MFFLLLSIGLVITAVIYWYLRKWKLERVTANIPSLPGELSVLGHALQFMGDDTEFWNFIANVGHTTNKLGGVAKFWVGPYLSFFITDPTLVKELMNNVLEKSDYYDSVKKWLGQGLVTANVPTWKRHRKLLNPTFNQQMLNGFLQVMNTEAANLTEMLEQNVGRGKFDVFPITTVGALETLMKTALGFDQPSDFVKEYGKMAEIMFNVARIRFQHLWMTIDSLYYWTGTKKEEDNALKQITNMSTTVINKKKATYQNMVKENHFKTILDVLIEHELDGSLNHQEVREEVDTIITAGSDTIATAMVYILVMIGSYPEVQEKVYSEVQKIFGSSKRDVTKEDIPLLVYTEAVIKEVLRIYPTVPLISRNTRNGNVVCGKYTFPKNTNIHINIYGMHNGASWGDDAEVFRPERWLTPGGVPDQACCYAPFSTGRRNCIGITYAMMSMKVTIVQLIRRYRVKAGDTPLVSKWNTLMKPASGSEISIEFR